MNASSTNSGRGDAPLWLTVLAKFGYAARGVIYLLIGGLALLQAFGQGGQTTGSKGAISSLTGSTVGLAVLWFIAIGLFGYALWRAVQGILDADGHGTDGKGIAVRSGLIVSAISHALLGVYAISIALGSGSSSGGGGGGGKSGLVAKMLGWPGGKWIAILAGLCIIGAGVAQGIKAHKTKYEKRFVIDPETMKKIEPICKFGLYAKGAVFAIIGGMFVYAAWTQDPEKAGGIQAVLDGLREQSFGWVILGIMAAGLIAFGLYSIFEAMYREIDKPDSLDPTEEG